MTNLRDHQRKLFTLFFIILEWYLKKKQLRDGEFIDFIIIHPDKGMIFLECKGGLVQYKPLEKNWYHYKQNEWKPIKPSPTEDAKFGKNNLIKFLKKELQLNQNNSWIDDIPTIHGAIFPNTPKPKGDLPPDIKPEMIIWADDYINLETSINKMFDFASSTLLLVLFS